MYVYYVMSLKKIQICFQVKLSKIVLDYDTVGTF